MKTLRSMPRTSALSLLLVALFCLPATAAPPGEQLIDKVFKAYQDVLQYDATMHLAMRQPRGKWTSSLEGDVHVVLDRAANRIRVELPDQLLVVDGKTLFFRNDGMPGKHLAVPIPAKLNYEWIVQQIPSMSFPFGPTDLALLLSDDLPSFLSQAQSGEPAMIQSNPNDPAQRPRIQMALPVGLMTLTLDPKTHLIDQAVIVIDPAAAGASGPTDVVYTFDFQVHHTDQPIAEDRFTFDTTGSTASPSMQHMMASGSNAPHPLTGLATPELVLPDLDGNDYDLALDTNKVIVLDFWATWCPPCVAALPELQEVYDWTQEDGGRSVAIYAVNQGETAEEVKTFWADKGLSIPVLMDEKFVTAQAFMVNGIPQTVIIANGKVQHVHVGFRPGVGEQIKAEIEALLDAGVQ